MDLFLMQHGEALTGAVDSARPLSEVGRRSVSRTGLRALASGVRLDRVVHSGKVRAEQSANILAQALDCRAVEKRAGLAPDDPVDEAVGWVIESAGHGQMAVVGHMPFMDRLASLLVAGDETAHVVAFRNGGLVRLTAPDGVEPGQWRVGWVITPETA